MKDYGLYKNGEGYSDPTAAEAIKGMAKPGEIWKYKGREVLIIKNQGGYCNVLTLSTAQGKDKNTIEVAGLYTTPGKLNYVFNDLLGAKVKQITKDEYDSVVQEICRALPFRHKSEPVADTPEENKSEAIAETAVCMDYEAENKALKQKNALLRSMYDDLLTKFLDRFGGCESHG